MPLALRDAILFTVVLYEVIMIWGSLSWQFDRCPYKHVFKRRFATFDFFRLRNASAWRSLWFLVYSFVWGRFDMWWAFCQYASFRADSGYCVFGEAVNENLTLEISKSFPLLKKNSRTKMDWSFWMTASSESTLAHVLFINDFLFVCHIFFWQFQSFPPGTRFFGTLPSLGLFVNVSITTPLYFFCLCSVIESTGSDACRTQGTPINGMARLFFVLLLTTVGWSLPQILPIIGVFSSVFCVTWMF